MPQTSATGESSAKPRPPSTSSGLEDKDNALIQVPDPERAHAAGGGARLARERLQRYSSSHAPFV